MQFEKMPLQQENWMVNMENLPLQPGSSHVAARICMQRGGTIIWP
jgi:hypothetical protein